MRTKFILFMLVFIVSKTTYACSCGPVNSVIQDFEEVRDVFTAKITSLRKAPKRGKNYWYKGFNGVNAVVMKVYKGTLKPGDRLFFKQGGGADCNIQFDNKSIGKNMLIFQDIAGEYKPAIEYCNGRGNNKDLYYVENLDTFRGKTSISGNYRMTNWFENHLLPLGGKIRFIGEGEDFEVGVDYRGVYEIFIIKPGKYRIFPDVPAGFTLDEGEIPPPYLIEDDEPPPTNKPLIELVNFSRRSVKKSLEITLIPGKHNRLDIFLKRSKS